MKTEMDILGMDERDRLCWSRANRITLIVVGIAWLSVIALEFRRGNTPWFMMAMVPVFAGVRFMAYAYLRGVGHRDHGLHGVSGTR